MDGDLSDWNLLPPEYIFELQHQREVRDGLVSGVYIYRLQSSHQIQSRKLLLLT